MFRLRMGGWAFIIVMVVFLVLQGVFGFTRSLAETTTHSLPYRFPEDYTCFFMTFSKKGSRIV